MRMSIPLAFWALQVIRLDYTDAFTPPNLQNFWIGNAYGGFQKDASNRREQNDRSTMSKLQRLWATPSNENNETDPEARRIRSAYLQWCERYKKQVDESRYPQFVSNFKVMQSIALKGGKPMHLNEYADFTGQEYEAMLQQKKRAEQTA